MAVNLVKSTKIFNQLKEVSETVEAMKSELQPAIDTLDAEKRRKTTLTDNLRDSVLEELPRPVVGDFMEGKISAFFEQEFSVTSDGDAIRQIIQYAANYKEITGVDIIASLLSVKIGNVKDRVVAAPREFGLVAKTDEDGGVTWVSNGMKIDMVKKVRVAREL